MQRRVIPELLDEDLGTPAEIAASLKDLRHINDWFGGTRTSITLLRRIARELNTRDLSLLEVGSGSGDVPLAARKRLANNGFSLDVTLLDRLSAHLPPSGIAAVSADVMRMPFAEGSFDVVGCTLFAHHFDPALLQAVCRESLRVARHAVVINDLIRSRLHLLLVYLGLPLFRSRITWHDAPASVRAAYTPKEIQSISVPLRVRRVDISRHYLFRMGVVLWK